MPSLRAQGRGRNDAPARGAVELVLRRQYTGGWAGALWGRLPGRSEVRVLREGLDLLALGGDYVFLDATPQVADTLRRLVASVPARTKVAVVGLDHVAGRGAALLLCGHTNGGQVALPGPTPIVVPGPGSRRYPFGRHEVDGLTLLVSCGLGGVEVPFCAFAPPDVLVVELRPG